MFPEHGSQDKPEVWGASPRGLEVGVSESKSHGHCKSRAELEAEARHSQFVKICEVRTLTDRDKERGRML